MTTPFDHERWEELAVAHALQALEPGDAATFGTHLSDCARCRGIIDDVAATAGDLALSVEQVAPPARLKSAILGEVHRSGRVVADVTAPAGDTDSPVIAIDLEERRSRRAARLRAVPGPWLVAVAAAAALAFGLAAVVTKDGGSAAPRTAAVGQAFVQCLDDPTCRPIRLLDSSGAVVAAVMVRDSRAEIVNDGLAPNAAASTTYVLWAQHTTGSVKAVGVFDVTDKDASVHALDTLPWRLSDISAFLVSKEAGNVAPQSGSAPIARGSTQV